MPVGQHAILSPEDTGFEQGVNNCPCGFYDIDWLLGGHWGQACAGCHNYTRKETR